MHSKQYTLLAKPPRPTKSTKSIPIFQTMFQFQYILVHVYTYFNFVLSNVNICFLNNVFVLFIVVLCAEWDEDYFILYLLGNDAEKQYSPSSKTPFLFVLAHNYNQVLKENKIIYMSCLSILMYVRPRRPVPAISLLVVLVSWGGGAGRGLGFGSRDHWGLQKKEKNQTQLFDTLYR